MPFQEKNKRNFYENKKSACFSCCSVSAITTISKQTVCVNDIKQFNCYFRYSAKKFSSLSNGIASFPPPSYRSVWTTSGMIKSSLLSAHISRLGRYLPEKRSCLSTALLEIRNEVLSHLEQITNLYTDCRTVPITNEKSFAEYETNVSEWAWR